jgi:hypothetical protein
MGSPHNWFGGLSSSGSSGSSSNSGGGGWGWWYVSGPVELEGCAYVLAAIVLLIVAVILLWFLIEVAIPLLAFLMYWVIRGMLARVANDRHHCHHRPVRSFLWGALWATLYTAPLAGAVWCVHLINQSAHR